MHPVDSLNRNHHSVRSESGAHTEGGKVQAQKTKKDAGSQRTKREHRRRMRSVDSSLRCHHSVRSESGNPQREKVQSTNRKRAAQMTRMYSMNSYHRGHHSVRSESGNPQREKVQAQETDAGSRRTGTERSSRIQAVDEWKQSRVAEDRYTQSTNRNRAE
jgi:hypothetical protein